MKLLRSIALIIVVSGIVAWLIVEWKNPDLPSNSYGPTTRVSLQERQTVSLSERKVQQTISGSGSVVPGDTPDTWVIEVALMPADLAIDLLERPLEVNAILTGGAAGFECGWLGIDRGMDGRVSMRCEIPTNISAANGMLATIVVQLTPSQTVIGLPRTAVLGDADRGQVIVVESNGTIEVRDVNLGISGSDFIEITDGLSADDQVLLVPMQRDFSEAGRE